MVGVSSWGFRRRPGERRGSRRPRTALHGIGHVLAPARLEMAPPQRRVDSRQMARFRPRLQLPMCILLLPCSGEGPVSNANGIPPPTHTPRYPESKTGHSLFRLCLVAEFARIRARLTPRILANSATKEATRHSRTILQRKPPENETYLLCFPLGVAGDIGRWAICKREG